MMERPNNRRNNATAHRMWLHGRHTTVVVAEVVAAAGMCMYAIVCMFTCVLNTMPDVIIKMQSVDRTNKPTATTRHQSTPKASRCAHEHRHHSDVLDNTPCQQQGTSPYTPPTESPLRANSSAEEWLSAQRLTDRWDDHGQMQTAIASPAPAAHERPEGSSANQPTQTG